jgi:hypothetical protein
MISVFKLTINVPVTNVSEIMDWVGGGGGGLMVPLLPLHSPTSAHWNLCDSGPDSDGHITAHEKILVILYVQIWSLLLDKFLYIYFLSAKPTHQGILYLYIIFTDKCIFIH